MALQDKIGREEIVDKICGLVGSLKGQELLLGNQRRVGKRKIFCVGID